MTDRFDITSARRLVIKVGSSLLFDRETRALNKAWLNGLIGDIAAMKARGQDVIVVSSGAIALGRHRLGLSAGILKLEEAQAAASVGQIDLAHAYREGFDTHGIGIAQILLTLWDTEDRRRYLNARSTLHTLLKLGTVPVVNENDAVATTEIRYGDNDRLAARISVMTSSDALVLLSDIDGLYSEDPKNNPQAEHFARIETLSSDVFALAGEPPPKDASQLGSGGMASKLEAARSAVGAGAHVVIASGAADKPLSAVENGARHTWFVAHETPVQARKHWIAGSLAPQGTLTIDEGAVSALARGMSLLPAGVKAVSGAFERGDAVQVVDGSGWEIARGLCAYGALDARAIMGRKSADIESILGFVGRKEMIHRDDLAFLAKERSPALEGDLK